MMATSNYPCRQARPMATNVLVFGLFYKFEYLTWTAHILQLLRGFTVGAVFLKNSSLCLKQCKTLEHIYWPIIRLIKCSKIFCPVHVNSPDMPSNFWWWAVKANCKELLVPWLKSLLQWRITLDVSQESEPSGIFIFLCSWANQFKLELCIYVVVVFYMQLDHCELPVFLNL